MSLLIFEYGMIAFFFATATPARPLSSAELVAAALLVLSRPAGILLGGLIGMRPGIHNAPTAP
jgi:hypothetical protein